MGKEYIIRRQIEKSGSIVTITDGDWKSVPFRAFISPLWRRKSSNFENKLTEIGGNLSEYYLYIGSAKHCITDLSENALLEYDGEFYEFKHRDKAFFNNEVIYYNGILRKLKGDWQNEG